MTIRPQNAELARQLRSLSIVQESGPEHSRATSAPPTSNTRRWPLILALTIVATAGVGVWAVGPDALTQTATTFGFGSTAPMEEVATAPTAPTIPAVTPIPLAPQGVIGTGYVVAEREIVLGTELGGRVAAVTVGVGDTFAQGQVLARLDDSTARLNLSLADQAVRNAEQALSRLQVQREEATVAAGRLATLVARGAAPQADQDSAAFAVRLVDSDIAAASGAVETRRLERQAAMADLARHSITAPFDGVVVEQLVVPGDLVASAMNGGDPTNGLLTLLDTTSLIVAADLAETNLAQVQTGQRAEVVLDAWPDRSFAAHVLGIVPRASIQKGTVTVRLTFDAPDAAILANMAAKVTFAAEPTQ